MVSDLTLVHVVDGQSTAIRSVNQRISQRLIEFAIGQQAGIAGDLCPVEFESNLAVEIDPQGLLFAFTYLVLRS